MNKAKMIELFESGAYYNIRECLLYHPSFRKGCRKVLPGNISLQAAEKHFSEKMIRNNGTYKLA